MDSDLLPGTVKTSLLVLSPYFLIRFILLRRLVVPSVKWTTLGPSSGLDLRGREFETHTGLHDKN